MSLTILFALGHEEEANKSFVSEVAQYSSLNYGCKKIQKCKVLFTDNISSC